MIPETTATMEKFGYPATLVGDLHWWAALYRPKQATLGSLVLAAKCGVTAFSELPAEAFTEMGKAVGAIEACLKSFCRYERINYLMLMMVDPHPHFHVIPRYHGARTFAGANLEDHGWPGPPLLDRAVTLESRIQSAAIEELRALWRKVAA